MVTAWRARPSSAGYRAARAMAALLLLAALALPAASAHGSSLGENGVFRMPGHYVFLDFTPAWPFAGQPVRFEGSIHHLDGSLARNATLELSFHSGGLSQGPFAMAWTSERTPHVVLDHAFPAAGAWTLRLAVREGNVTGASSDSLAVYPVLPWFVLGEGAAAFAPGPATLAIGVRAVDGQPPGPEVRDLQARITRLADGVNWTVAAAPVDPPWHWRLETAFDRTGDHIAEFASTSGGFRFGDMPPLDIDVATAAGPTDAPSTSKGSAGSSPPVSGAPSAVPSFSTSLDPSADPQGTSPEPVPVQGASGGARSWLVAFGALGLAALLAWSARRR